MSAEGGEDGGLQRGEGFGGFGLGVVVAGDVDVDDAAAVDVFGEEDGGEFDEALVFCEEDGDAGVDFADGEGDEHVGGSG